MKINIITTTLCVATVIFIVLFGTLLNTKVQEDKTLVKQHAVERVCREWQDTHPQSNTYDDCVQRNTRYLEE